MINGIYYNLSGSIATVTYKTVDVASYSGSVTIPSSVTYGGTTYTVTIIGEKAFKNCTGLTSVTIPSTVTHIQNYAFYGCTSLSCSNGYSYFFVPATVTDIGWYVFGGGNSITSFVVASANSDYSSYNGVLYDKNKSSLWYFPCKSTSKKLTSSFFPSTLTTIEEGAFHSCALLEHVELPSAVTTIYPRAFSGCTSLAMLSLPPSVTTIGYAAFIDCSSLHKMECFATTPPTTYSSFPEFSLDTLYVPSTVVSSYTSTDYEWKYTPTIIGMDRANFVYDGIYYRITNSNYKYAAVTYKEVNYDNTTYQGEITLTNTVPFNGNTYTVRAIDYQAFYYNHGLTAINIPESVTSIGERAFYDCI